MTSQEAIETIKIAIAEIEWDYPMDYAVAFEMAIEALERKIPKAEFFDYGIVTYQHRFSINRSLNDYEEITLNKCIRMGVQFKYYTMACDKLVAEMQIVYKDENDNLHCLCEDLHDFTFCIKHKGDMMINL